MSKNKFIHWSNHKNDDGHVQCNIVYMIGYCPNTIGQFTKMAEEVVKDFPNLKVSQFEGGKVYKSVWCFGFTVVAWYGYIEKRDYEGWNIN